MPVVGGIVVRLARPGVSLSLDLSGEALSHDGVADIVDVTAPENGTLVQEEIVGSTRQCRLPGQRPVQLRLVQARAYRSVVDIEVSNRGVFMDTWFASQVTVFQT